MFLFYLCHVKRWLVINECGSVVFSVSIRLCVLCFCFFILLCYLCAILSTKPNRFKQFVLARLQFRQDSLLLIHSLHSFSLSCFVFDLYAMWFNYFFFIMYFVWTGKCVYHLWCTIEIWWIPGIYIFWDHFEVVEEEKSIMRLGSSF